MSRPWMPLYIGDYRRDTARLGAAEHGAYLLLIMEYWVTGGLPDDDKQLARIACMSPAEWKRARPIVAAFFQPGWKHKRIDTELATNAEKAAKRAEKAAEAANKRWSKHATSNAPSMPKACPNDAMSQSQSQSQSHKIDDADDAGASLIRPEAFALSDEIRELCGHDAGFPPPQWCGAPHRIEAWLAGGWTRDGILIGVKKALAKKRGPPPSSVNYFEKPIAEAIAELSRPLPTVVVDNTPETVHVRTQTDRSILGGFDSLKRRAAEFGRTGSQALAGGQPGRVAVPLLPKDGGG